MGGCLNLGWPCEARAVWGRGFTVRRLRKGFPQREPHRSASAKPSVLEAYRSVSLSNLDEGFQMQSIRNARRLLEALYRTVPSTRG